MLNVAWERQPQGYRDMCKRFGAQMGPLQPTGLRKPLSPQNRRVRQAVDLQLCSGFEAPPPRDTRQQRREKALGRG